MGPKSEWINKQNPVGNFFERVVLEVLGGELVRNEDGDIVIEKESTTIEVKASYLQSSYGFRLSTEQIDFYKRISGGFPYDRNWYVFCAYNNPTVTENGRRVNAFAKHRTVVEMERYLAESLAWCLLVDFSIIEKWREKLPHSDKSVMGHLGMETVNLHAKRVVYPFTNGGLEGGLRDLGLDPKTFGVLSGRIKTRLDLGLYDKHHIVIPVRAVVPREQVPVLRRVLRRRGFYLKLHTLN